MAKKDTIVADFIVNTLSQEEFDRADKAGELSAYEIYGTPDTTKERLDTLESRATSLEETKQDEATAVNYDNITNCITHIPQDIKLELDTNTHTIKLTAGSKYYYPDGTNTFNGNTTTTELTLEPIGTWTGQSLIYVVDGSALAQAVDNTSGTTAPTANGAWYDTNTNYIKLYLGGSDAGVRYSLPIAIATRTNGEWTSIDQVFNGFGYIGSTKFILPGVKGLIPNGKNADGTLKNTVLSITEVRTFTGASTDNTVVGVVGNNNITNYHTPELSYDAESNYMIHSGDIVDMIPYTNSYSQVGGKIDSNITFKQAFHAVDYSDTGFIANQAMPSDRYIDLPLPASGGSLSMPADGYLNIIKYGNANQFIQIHSSPMTVNKYAPNYNGVIVMISCPVRKGQDVVINYDLSGATNVCRFIYANGVQ